MKIEMVSIHFWILHILFTIAIIGGLLYRISTIMQGSLSEYAVSGLDGKSRWHKFWYFVGKFFKTFFSRKFGPIVLSIIFDSILHTKLFKENKIKWLAHTLLFWGILVLFILSVLSGVAVEMAPLFNYQPGTSEFLDALANKDHWVTAVLNEVLNVVILIGVLVAFVRGLFSKKKIGMMMFQDVFLLIFIFVILLTGWFTESFRYIIERTPQYIGKLGFVGFYMGRGLQNAFPQATDAAWIASYKVFWHAHVSAIWLAFVYIPFSKFAHALFSPVASVINVMEKNKHSKGQVHK